MLLILLKHPNFRGTDMNRPEAGTGLKDTQGVKRAGQKAASKTGLLFSNSQRDRHFCESELKFTRRNEANNSFVLGYN